MHYGSHAHLKSSELIQAVPKPGRPVHRLPTLRNLAGKAKHVCELTCCNQNCILRLSYRTRKLTPVVFLGK